jgi:hypothetical protein
MEMMDLVVYQYLIVVRPCMPQLKRSPEILEPGYKLRRRVSGTIGVIVTGDANELLNQRNIKNSA